MLRFSPRRQRFAALMWSLAILSLLFFFFFTVILFFWVFFVWDAQEYVVWYSVNLHPYPCNFVTKEDAAIAFKCHIWFTYLDCLPKILLTLFCFLLSIILLIDPFYRWLMITLYTFFSSILCWILFKVSVYFAMGFFMYADWKVGFPPILGDMSTVLLSKQKLNATWWFREECYLLCLISGLFLLYLPILCYALWKTEHFNYNAWFSPEENRSQIETQIRVLKVVETVPPKFFYWYNPPKNDDVERLKKKALELQPINWRLPDHQFPQRFIHNNYSSSLWRTWY